MRRFQEFSHGLGQSTGFAGSLVTKCPPYGVAKGKRTAGVPIFDFLSERNYPYCGEWLASSDFFERGKKVSVRRQMV